MLSRYAVLKYIAKYASKVEKRSESYHHILTIISNSIGSEDHALCAYRRFLAETIIDPDIGAHEMCHMLLKLPIVVCSWKFVSLNVGRKFLGKYPWMTCNVHVRILFFNIIKRDLFSWNVYL